MYLIFLSADVCLVVFKLQRGDTPPGREFLQTFSSVFVDTAGELNSTEAK